MRRAWWSIRRKLICVILLVLTGMGSGLIALVVIGAEQERQQEAFRLARTLSANIERTLRSAMLSGEREIVRAAVETVSRQNDVISIVVFDGSGRPAVQAGGQTAVLQQKLHRLIAGGSQPQDPSPAPIGDTAHAIVSPVRSERACARCHGQNEKLGYIGAVVSTAGEEQKIDLARNRLLWGGLLVLGGACLTIYMAVFYWVERPITVLTQAVESLRTSSMPPASGTGGDEIARLKSSFDAMVSEISQGTEALLKAERDLANSQRLASIGLLAAGIAHEIGNPLSTIYLQAGFWQEQGPGPWQAAAAAIAEAARRIGGLQKELLTFDHKEALNFQQCDLRHLVQNCLGLVRRPGLQCEFKAPSEPLLVSADPVLLGRALGNILSNASQAVGDEGRLLVALRLPEEDTVEITVQDSGPGILPEDLPYVFEPFFTRKKGERSSGLGLAIAREIIIRHRGDVGVESTPAGARFRITMPLLR